jgi:hypothetical protein
MAFLTQNTAILIDYNINFNLIIYWTFICANDAIAFGCRGEAVAALPMHSIQSSSASEKKSFRSQ